MKSVTMLINASALIMSKIIICLLTNEACKACGTIEEMFDEAKAQVLKDCRSESLQTALGDKVLKCKICSCKDTSDAMAGVCTINVSNMVCKSLKMKCDDNLQNEMNPDPHVSENSITFLPLKERFDIITYCYPLHGLSLETKFYQNSDVRHQVATRQMNKLDWKHHPSCFKYGKEWRCHFPRQGCMMTQFEDDNNEE